ncbi:MAG: hypothetical protein K2N78_08445 [Oscillospiraceae bacterium]|nr:hypothetical protein [Oscillospiraceae bacterium]
MALRLDSFGLTELAARPEDAFRLASLAMAEGQRIPGYGGDYYRMRVGDAQVVVRTRGNQETGEEELVGMDTHAASGCLWDCEVVKDLTPPDAPPLSRRVLVKRGDGGDTAAVDLLCADVLPDLRAGGFLRMNMAGFPLRIAYSEGESTGVVEAQEDTVLLEGVITDAKVGETYLGMEPLTKFVSVTVSTRMGDIELCHPMELTAENQRDLVKPGSVVSAYCVLSGDAAAGEYAGGIIFDENRDLTVLAAFFRDGTLGRLGPVLRSDCACTFLANRQEGLESALTLLKVVREDLAAAGLDRVGRGTATGEGRRKCLLLGGEQGWAFLCLLDTDSLGRVREIVITNDPKWDFELDEAQSMS